MKLNTSVTVGEITMYLKEEEEPKFGGAYQIGQMLFAVNQGNSQIQFDFEDMQTIERFLDVVIQFRDLCKKSIVDEKTRECGNIINYK